VIPRRRLGSRSISVLVIFLGHLGIVVWLNRVPVASHITVEDAPTMRLTFFDEPPRTSRPQSHPTHARSNNSKGSPNSKSRARTKASPATLNVTADASAAAPQLPAPRVDWAAEAQRTAQDYISRTTHDDSIRSLDSHGTGPRVLRSPARGHLFGDTEHFDGGEIIDWIDERCYYGNRDPNGNLPPMHGVTGLAPAYLTGIPICKPR
jgi:hypothetical protein